MSEVFETMDYISDALLFIFLFVTVPIWILPYATFKLVRSIIRLFGESDDAK